ncbi:MAG: cytochrome b/b6 domain-containing protein [Caulobacteraceae bacterium]
MTRPGVGVIWDLPTRIFHWSIVVLIPFSWWSATSGHLPWHRLSGYTILGLIAFRLIWGVIGSETARFSRFLRGPAAAHAYLTGRLRPVVGHNPLAGWSVAAMLVVLFVQVGLGLFSVDEDGFQAGPLDKFVSFDTGRKIAHLHHLNFYLLLALIALHLSAVAIYAVRGRNLVSPMITGIGSVPLGEVAPRTQPLWRFLAAALPAVLISWFIARGLSF